MFIKMTFWKENSDALSNPWTPFLFWDFSVIRSCFTGLFTKISESFKTQSGSRRGLASVLLTTAMTTYQSMCSKEKGKASDPHALFSPATLVF